LFVGSSLLRILKGAAMIVLIDGVRYQLTTPDSEDSLEKTIQSNCQHIFGPDSFYFDIKRLIRTKAGVASIPDGYVIFFTPEPRWGIVEVELASHPIYDHLIPQLTKFNRGIEDSATRKQLVEVLYGIFSEDEVQKVRLKQKIKTGEVYKFISDLLSENPLIVVVIDQKTAELEEAVRDIRGDVKIVEFKTFRREGISEGMNAFVFEPLFKAYAPPKIDVGQKPVTPGPKPKLLHKLPAGLKLRNVYKGMEFTAEVLEGGRIRFRDTMYESLSGAAVAAIQSTGFMGGKVTANGWTWWKFVDKETGEEKVVDSFDKIDHS
jgi:hypothetical protein